MSLKNVALGSSPRVRSRPVDVVHLARVLGIISACAEQTQRFLIQSPMTRDHLRVCGADSHGGPGNGPNLGSSPRVRSRLHAAIWLFHPAGIISACAEQTRTLPTRYAFNRDHLRVCGADLGVSGFQPAVLGSSPRVRSRLSSRKRTAAKSRIISACAEQTDPSSLFNVFPKDHLRVCGADCENRVERPLDSGSSPRVRSRQRRQRSALRLAGIISACAEQTNPFHVKRLSARDHLRVCGADAFQVGAHAPQQGSSPRVRSRHVFHRASGRTLGIISACAEQTRGLTPTTPWSRDHLRVCGADTLVLEKQRATIGSSPRVRSRLPCPVRPERGCGIISACAEQTDRAQPERHEPKDHLRVCGADVHRAAPIPYDEGSSPRVRSRPARRGEAAAGRGIISACAEQTLSCSLTGSGSWDHLRVCGADFRDARTCWRMSGSSPRVRSRPRSPPWPRAPPGIISACAEQTTGRNIPEKKDRDHLRVCGADLLVPLEPDYQRGSSPRVRSRRAAVLPLPRVLGIISACAEQTSSSPSSMAMSWDHLRVCGADGNKTGNTIGKAGSSPRVRSRPRARGLSGRTPGIISACAEQTLSARSSTTRFWDHLRVCGADISSAGDYRSKPGSSPRVRSRLIRLAGLARVDGIISACAEQTSVAPPVMPWIRDHLRVCGADVDKPTSWGQDIGSSPRVRSRPERLGNARRTRRIISACAEQTSPVARMACSYEDHLRVCGADRSSDGAHLRSWGSSPRVRSRRCCETSYGA